MFRDWSIQRKLKLVIMGTTVAALWLACAGFLIYDLSAIRRSIAQDIATVGQILGRGNTAAISFKDAEAAEESLKAFSERKSIIEAAIFFTNGQLFAKYLRPGITSFQMPVLRPAGAYFGNDDIELFIPIHLENEIIGTVYVRSDQEEMYARFRQYTGIVALVIIGSMVLAYLLSTVLQKVISNPILHLAEVMRKVTVEKNYAVRAQKENKDEFGQLVDGFNEMLAEIQNRDAALQKGREELEKRVDERTHALQQEIVERKQAEEHLRQLTGKLERSNRELQDFAYVASHDLQEPLRKVQAFGDRLRRRYAEPLGEEGRDYLERMENAARRMQNLINDLLLFSRVSTKPHPFEKISLEKIAQEVLSDLEVRLQQTNGKVQIDRLPEIEADPVQFRQLLQNLLSNALKFHKPEIPPFVHVSARIFRSAGPGNGNIQEKDWCEIKVQDNGIGFEEKYLDRIFAVFQRLHGRGTYEGTGIGLAICRKIAERHGGSITACSKVDEGSTFIVQLPMRQTKSDQN